MASWHTRDARPRRTAHSSAVELAQSCYQCSDWCRATRVVLLPPPKVDAHLGHVWIIQPPDCALQRRLRHQTQTGIGHSARAS
jgi:hypothetical protein